MKGMGWTEGEGLGKEKQGISTPFILQKTDTRTGVIVNAQPLHGQSTQVIHACYHATVLLLESS